MGCQRSHANTARRYALAIICDFEHANEQQCTFSPAELGLVPVMPLTTQTMPSGWAHHFSEAGLAPVAKEAIHVDGWHARVPVPVHPEGVLAAVRHDHALRRYKSRPGVQRQVYSTSSRSLYFCTVGAHTCRCRSPPKVPPLICAVPSTLCLRQPAGGVDCDAAAAW